MSRLRCITVHPVFEYSRDETDFWPSKQFSADLMASHYPFIIMFVGNSRVGKSAHLNQLLLHKLKSDIPFEAFSGADPVTMKFQYLGPWKFRQLSQIHSIDLHVTSDPDIFLIDCEGLHSLGKTTAVLKQATFSLSQMVSMTVLVMKEQVNHENIENVRSLFVLSHAFSRQRWNSISTRTKTHT
jgi:septin family protein